MRKVTMKAFIWSSTPEKTELKETVAATFSEFTAHNVCKDEELNLIAATTNYNFQTTNSLTERTGVRLSHR